MLLYKKLQSQFFLRTIAISVAIDIEYRVGASIDHEGIEGHYSISISINNNLIIMIVQITEMLAHTSAISSN